MEGADDVFPLDPASAAEVGAEVGAVGAGRQRGPVAGAVEHDVLANETPSQHLLWESSLL
ncbi:hypothetical protein GCM10010218_60820 [Streptomyces mashuensis]|uniref:Uncharacterized protein n=1 Tax=Streptomyces mashuensis TaxID=33904 RepID=A0A919EG80_9ACTN|nr:hypothetical protein [Streptomyces mashuensis]GHF71467.1 hypothetical protein GCM10010218_60820 [Streptomyces mashuensis]